MLIVKEVEKSFNELLVLNNINFEIKDSEIVAIIGPSGCGKSTLLNVISGLVQPDKGLIAGADNAISCVFQDDRLLPWRNVWENVSLANDKENPLRIQELIEAVGLSGFEKYYPSQLSGGMKKRCGIARAFYHSSELLLLDEPFQGLDYCLRREMLDMLLKVWRMNKQSVLFITHEIEEALTVASKILVLSNRPGKIVKEFVLPDKEGRNPMSLELYGIREEIISIIMKERRTDGIA